jgi:hypothetical protein
VGVEKAVTWAWRDEAENQFLSVLLLFWISGLANTTRKQKCGDFVQIISRLLVKGLGM